MRIGIPKECKAGEGRVALLPRHAKKLVAAGHTVIVETGAGEAAGADDEAYVAAGATIVKTASAVFRDAELIAKVKELRPNEYPFVRHDHTIVTNIHPGFNRDLTDLLLHARCTAFAIEDAHGAVSTNCAMAGEMAALFGVANRLTLSSPDIGGPNPLPTPHFAPHFRGVSMRVLILGAGVCARGAIRVLRGLGCDITVLNRGGSDESEARMAALRLDFPDIHTGVLADVSAQTWYSDIIFNCLNWPKDQMGTHIITRSMLTTDMRPGTLIVDVACDPAGAVETCRPTTWNDPIYTVDGVHHFCVDNLAGLSPVTASAGYGDMIVDQVAAIAEFGPIEAALRSPRLKGALLCAEGVLLREDVGRYQRRPFSSLLAILTEGRAASYAA